MSSLCNILSLVIYLFTGINACFRDKLANVGAVVATQLVEQALDSDGRLSCQADRHVVSELTVRKWTQVPEYYAMS